MYIVKWCNHEGNLDTRRFDRLEDARIEATVLYDEYGWAEIEDKCGILW